MGPLGGMGSGAARLAYYLWCRREVARSRQKVVAEIERVLRLSNH